MTDNIFVMLSENIDPGQTLQEDFFGLTKYREPNGDERGNPKSELEWKRFWLTKRIDQNLHMKVQDKIFRKYGKPVELTL